MSAEPSGYDDPISAEDADLLGRSGFAREIATLAIAGPSEWSTRIGVYGLWGEGKTSVLRLARDLLRGDGHFVVDFNPWGCGTSEQMVALLADEIVANVNERELRPLPGTARRLAKWGASIASAVTQHAGDVPLGKAAPAVPVVKAIARGISPWLQRWAHDRRSDIEAALKHLGEERRLVVLVDDVDRLDPKLLPGLMFAMHEAFALPGLSYIVALDPEVVGSALHQYHPGFGDGLAFLEKIIQFPRWLPPSDSVQRLRIAEADRKLHAPFLRSSTLELNRELLPKNPRELRMLIRGLMPLARVFDRHDDNELDENLLLLIECLRQRFPRTLASLVESEDLLDSTFTHASSETFVDAVFALATNCNELLERDVERKQRLEQLSRAFCGRSMFWNAKNIRYHALLIDRPHAVTWREFREAPTGPIRDASVLDTWIDTHAARIGASRTQVVIEFFDCLVRAYGKALDEAADVGASSIQDAAHGRAATSISVIAAMWFESKYWSEVQTPENFLQLVRTFRPWAHFILSERDRDARDAEQKLLLRIAGTYDRGLELLDELAPWLRSDRSEQAKALTAELDDVLRERSADAALEIFGEQSGINTAFTSPRLARRYLLTFPRPTWDKVRRDRLEAMSIERPEVVADNVRAFVTALLQDDGGRPGARELLNDRSLVELFWRCLTRVRWQARMFRSISKLRTALERDAALPEPAWWGAVASEIGPE